MRYKNKFYKALAFIILFFCVFTQDAYAYLDPGTGSYFLQILIASLLGALFFIKSFWRVILRTIRSVFLKSFSLIKRDSK